MLQHLLNDQKRPQPKIDLTASTHDVQEIGAPTRHSWHGHAPCPSRSFSSASGSLPPSRASFTGFFCFWEEQTHTKVESSWLSQHPPWKISAWSQIGSFLKPLGSELKKSTLKPPTVVINTTPYISKNQTHKLGSKKNAIKSKHFLKDFCFFWYTIRISFVGLESFKCHQPLPTSKNCTSRWWIGIWSLMNSLPMLLAPDPLTPCCRRTQPFRELYRFPPTLSFPLWSFGV